MDDWVAVFWLVLYGIVAVSVFGAIFAKAGYSGWAGLLMLVPVVNVVAIVYLACAEWPIERNVKRLRLEAGRGGAEEIALAIADAARLEDRGEWEAAITAYEQIAATPGHGNADYAAACAQRVREKCRMRGCETRFGSNCAEA